MIAVWPETTPLACGCQVALRDNKLMYFPCRLDCPSLDEVKSLCMETGTTWEERHGNDDSRHQEDS
jgi:hypothetical protein